MEEGGSWRRLAVRPGFPNLPVAPRALVHEWPSGAKGPVTVTRQAGPARRRAHPRQAADPGGLTAAPRCRLDGGALGYGFSVTGRVFSWLAKADST